MLRNPLAALLALLTGCSSPKPPAPSKPGTSVQLSYPILLIGTLAPQLNVFDTELELTTTTKSSSLIYSSQQIIDSAGAFYESKKAIPTNEIKSPALMEIFLVVVIARCRLT